MTTTIINIDVLIEENTLILQVEENNVIPKRILQFQYFVNNFQGLNLCTICVNENDGNIYSSDCSVVMINLPALKLREIFRSVTFIILSRNIL